MRFDFSKYFQKRGRGLEFSHKKGRVGKIRDLF